MRLLWFVPVLALALPVAGEEPGITRSQADAILNELRQIRKILEQARQAPAAGDSEALPKATVKLGAGRSLGRSDAPITIVEYTDFQCPFCRRFHLNTFPELRNKYIDTGRVRFFSRDLPLNFHANAMRAAEAARCAADQNQFWPMRDLLSANADKLAEADIYGYAASLKLDAAAFRACLSSGKHKQDISADLKEASTVGISGTPSFVVGKTTAEGVDGVVVVGAQPLEAFENVFKQILLQQ